MHPGLIVVQGTHTPDVSEENKYDIINAQKIFVNISLTIIYSCNSS
jgi:hypothetical protein